MANSKPTRRGRYQVQRRPKILAQASDTRVKMRSGRASSEAPGSSTGAMLAALRAARNALTDAQAAALGAVMGGDSDARTGTDGG